MTMTKEHTQGEPTVAFWLTHPDPTQAAVHLALQWLAYVYPASELQIDRTLQRALPYADADLSSRWSQFLDEHDVEEHVNALEWAAETLSKEQIPFLVETCWRLLLVDHELPTHVPLALRILARVLSIPEDRIQALGETVFREYTEEDESRNRAPLLPVDPRYLDRVEWRLYGHTATSRIAVQKKAPVKRDLTPVYTFAWGSLFGAALVVGLVFGPLQLGRVKVPILQHQASAPGEQAAAPIAPVAEPVANQPAQTQTAEPLEEPVVASEPVAEAAQVEEPATEATTAPAPVETTNAPIVDVQAPVVSEGDAERVLMEVTASILNVREAPNVDSEILIKLAGGARVWAYPDLGEGLWMYVKVEGKVGFASARFLQELE